MSSIDASANLVAARESRLRARRGSSGRLRLSMRNLTSSRALGWSAVAALLLLWQYLATIHPSPGAPPPRQILDAWIAGVENGDLLRAVCETIVSMAYGFIIAIAIGLIVGVLMARVKFFYGLLEPFVELWRPIPSVVFIPVIILYLGLGQPMNVFVIVLAAAEPIVLNAFGGVRSVSPVLLDVASTFRLSWRQTLFEIVLPAALPQIFVGLRLALAKSLVIAVGAGMIAGNAGIGFYVLTAQQTLDIPKMYAGAITIAAVGYLLNLVILFFERRALRSRSRTETNIDV